jgi:hypothetical protein
MISFLSQSRFRRLAFILCLSAVSMTTLASQESYAATEAGVVFADEVSNAGQKLILNGTGLRTRLFFKVYAAGLYVNEKSKDAESILRSPAAKVLQLHFLRDVGADTIRGAWSQGFTKNCLSLCDESQAKIALLNGLMKDLKKGDVLSFSFRPDELAVELNGTSLGKVEGAKLDQNILAIFLGKEPPSPELKVGLLGMQK